MWSKTCDLIDLNKETIIFKIRLFNHISTKGYTKEQADKLVLELRKSYGYENVEVVE